MNDRYLFRAKRIDNGEWVEGILYPGIGLDKWKWIITIVDSVFMHSRSFKVDPSTICQCTGLDDKNGNLIWENDICIIRNGVIDEKDGYFRIDWESDRAMFDLEGTGLYASFDNIYGHECEVVGNIFDNPELLEQEEEEWTD